MKKLKYIISEHNFLMKVLNKRDEQELQTRIFDKSLEHKFWAKVVNKTCKQNF